jgi:hypothetical protein
MKLSVLELYSAGGRIIKENTEQLVEWEFAEKTEILGEILFQCHFVHQNFHMTWSGTEPEPPRWKAGN